MTNPSIPDIGGDAAIEPTERQQMQPWERLRLIRFYTARSYELQLAIATAQQNLMELKEKKTRIDYDLVQLMGQPHPAVMVATGQEVLVVNVDSSGIGVLLPIVSIHPLLAAEDLVEQVGAAACQLATAEKTLTTEVSGLDIEISQADGLGGEGLGGDRHG